MRGGTGAGDYFLMGWPYPEVLRYSQISFNPGENYQVVARWPTPSLNDWHRRNEIKQNNVTAEVIVQLRKDVTLVGTDRIASPAYPWDQDIEELVGWRRQSYLGEIEQVTQSLFA